MRPKRVIFPRKYYRVYTQRGPRNIAFHSLAPANFLLLDKLMGSGGYGPVGDSLYSQAYRTPESNMSVGLKIGNKVFSC